MKTVTYHECEICHCRYDNPQNAIDCEARSEPKQYPIGMIFGDNSKNAFYSKCLFAVAENDLESIPHTNRCRIWATRDNGSGNSLGDGKCCFTQPIEDSGMNNVDPTTPMFERMVKWLKSDEAKTYGVKEITVWNGEKPIPLNEWIFNKSTQIQINT